MKNFAHFIETKDHLVLEPLPYKRDQLSPVMSKATIDYHYAELAQGYVTRFNKGEGDPSFNTAGAFLHNLFFPQLQPPTNDNKPFGASLDLINNKYKSFEGFQKQIKDTAMKIQGSGWVYMNTDGSIETIKNHQVKNNIVLLIDWWEHAWALDYQSKKGDYLDNIWKIINWQIVNDRLNINQK